MAINMDTFRATHFHSENSIVQFTENGQELKSDKTTSLLHFDAIGRSEADIAANNKMRSQFLRAIANSMGMGEGITEQDGLLHFPEDLLTKLSNILGKALKAGDFEIKDGMVTSGKPLTQRRIRAIADAVAKHLMATAKASIPDISDMQLKSIVSNIKAFGIQDDAEKVQTYLQFAKKGLDVNGKLTGVKGEKISQMLDVLKGKKLEDLPCRAFANHIAAGEEPTEELFTTLTNLLDQVFSELMANPLAEGANERFMFLQSAICSGANVDEIKQFMRGEIGVTDVHVSATALGAAPGVAKSLDDAVDLFAADIGRNCPTITIRDSEGNKVMDYDPNQDAKCGKGDTKHDKSTAMTIASHLGNVSELVKAKVIYSFTQNANELLGAYEKQFSGFEAQLPKRVHFDVQLEKNGGITVRSCDSEETTSMNFSYAITYRPDGQCVEEQPFMVRRHQTDEQLTAHMNETLNSLTSEGDLLRQVPPAQRKDAMQVLNTLNRIGVGHENTIFRPLRTMLTMNCAELRALAGDGPINEGTFEKYIDKAREDYLQALGGNKEYIPYMQPNMNTLRVRLSFALDLNNVRNAFNGGHTDLDSLPVPCDAAGKCSYSDGFDQVSSDVNLKVELGNCDFRAYCEGRMEMRPNAPAYPSTSVQNLTLHEAEKALEGDLPRIDSRFSFGGGAMEEMDANAVKTKVGELCNDKEFGGKQSQLTLLLLAQAGQAPLTTIFGVGSGVEHSDAVYSLKKEDNGDILIHVAMPKADDPARGGFKSERDEEVVRDFHYDIRITPNGTSAFENIVVEKA